MPFADLGGRGLYYERFGSGQPLLLIQGMGGHHLSWGEPFLSGLAEDFDVVTYDHRGIGESDDVPGPFDVADLASDGARLLNVLGWDSAHVLGISLGGMVAQELALRYPRRLRRLVLGCTYAGPADSIAEAPGPAAMLAAMHTRDAEVATRVSFEVNLSPEFRADPAGFEEFRGMGLAVRVPVQVVVRQAQAAAAHDTRDRLPALAVPTLVLHGTADQMLLYDNGKLIATLIPQARLHAFDGVGHLFWWERPDETVELIRSHCLR